MAEVIRTELGGTAETDPVSKVVYVGPSISWRAIFAGAFVGILAFLALSMLGLALGGISIKEIAQGGGGSTGLLIGAGIWMVFSSIIALFVGGYVAGRSSGVLPSRIGGVEGLVVASLVFLLVFMGLGTGLGTLGSATGAMAGGVASTVTDLAGSPQVHNLVGRSLRGLNLRSSRSEVAQGLAARLVRGDEEAAIAYLAAQAGISRAEADQRLGEIKGQVMGAVRGVGKTAGNVTQALGWTFFVSIVLGALAALLGGVLAVRRNIRHPLSERDRRVAMEARPEWYGYVYGAPARAEPQST